MKDAVAPDIDVDDEEVILHNDVHVHHVLVMLMLIK